MSVGLLEVPASIRLLDRGVPVQGPANIAYSTSPRVCLGEDNLSYFVKGGPDESAMVAAEAVGYTLARALDIEVPDFAIVGGSLFASRAVEGNIRDAEPFIDKHKEAFARVIVLDIFLFNNDRNIGGFVAHPVRGLVALDFEKSQAVRLPQPLIGLSSFEAKSVMPRGTLATAARGLQVPWEFVRTVEKLPDSALLSATLGVAQAVPGYTWADASQIALKRRRDKLTQLVKEVWK